METANVMEYFIFALLGKGCCEKDGHTHVNLGVRSSVRVPFQRSKREIRRNDTGKCWLLLVMMNKTSPSYFSAWSYKTGKRRKDILWTIRKVTHKRKTKSKKKEKRFTLRLEPIVNLTSPKVVSVK